MAQVPGRGWRRIDPLALMIASLAAPASSFLIWAVWTVGTQGANDVGVANPMLGMIIATALFAGWGAMPAAAFGTPLLLLVHHMRPDDVPLWLLAAAGLVAAGLYAGCSIALASAGQGWVALIAPWAQAAPWTVDMNQQSFPHPPIPLTVSVILSGAVGAIAYRGVTRRLRSQA